MNESDNPGRGFGSLRQLSDEELARTAAKGDEGAARVLLERFEEPLHRYTVALVRDPDVAREATWSALLEGARAVRAGDYSEPVEPWLLQIAHASADVAESRPPGASGGDDEPAAIAAASAEPDRERLELLLAGLDALPDRDRSSLLLRELVGLEYAGIGTVTGARPAAARQAVYRARLALLGDAPAPAAHCDEIRAAMSKAETGIRERRSIASHLETCPACEEFATALERRPDDLRTLFPPPSERLAAELLPPLPPAGPPVPTAQHRGDRGPRERRGLVAPLVLALLLLGAAVATAIALNDNGGGKQGRAAAASQGTSQAGANGSGGANGSAGGTGTKPGQPKKATPAKPHAAAHAKPRAKSPAAHRATPKAAVPLAPGASGHTGSAKSGSSGQSGSSGTSGASGGQSGSSAGAGGTASGAGSGTSSGAGGAGSSGAGGQAKRSATCREGPATSPAESGYSGRAGATQAELGPCARADAASALASTGLDLTPVIAAALWLLSLGLGLRLLIARPR